MSGQNVNFLQVTGGICYAHGKFTGGKCPKWPDCITDPLQDEYITMASNDSVAAVKRQLDHVMEEYEKRIRVQAISQVTNLLKTLDIPNMTTTEIIDKINKEIK